MSNYYVRIGKKGVDVDELQVFNNCPGCGRPTLVDTFWDLMAGNDFNIYDASVYCDRCGKRVRKSRRAVILP